MKSTKRIYFSQLNKLAVATIVILILFSCANKKQKNDWIKDGLKGKVKSYTQFTYEAIDRFGKIEKGEMIGEENFFQNFQMFYDEKGNIIEGNWYNLDGTLREKYTYKYDEKRNVIEVNRYESDGSLDWKVIHKYDKKGNIIEDNRYESNGSLDEKNIYKYDKKGNKIEENRYKSDGNLDEKYTYKYDKKGNMIEDDWTYILFDGEEKIIKRSYTYEYDKYKNWIKKIKFEDEIPKTITEREFEYYE